MDRQIDFVQWFRSASPYIRAHRGQTFVICFGGEAVADDGFAHLVHDIALLSSLGIRLVLVHGARPQIEDCLNTRGVQMQYETGLRVTTDEALQCVKEAVSMVRLDIEALLSLGLPNSPMAGARIRVASGTFVTAKPRGVINGVDFRHTGEVRRVDAEAIRARLANDDVVLVSPLGYSPTGEIFNLGLHDVATAVASALHAGKLIFLTEGTSIVDEDGSLVRQLTQNEAQQYVAAEGEGSGHNVPQELPCAIRACRSGVRRTHLVDRHIEGALLLELFSRDGIGTLVSAEPFDTLRKATIDDVGGILELIEPLENEGVLVRRSREKLEMEVGHFNVLVRDGAIIACAAMYPNAEEGVAELACLAVQPEYRNEGRGGELFERLEREARQSGVTRLFVLTTQTAHWFLERGFQPGAIEDLPVARKALYNYQRNSKVFMKEIGARD